MYKIMGVYVLIASLWPVASFLRAGGYSGDIDPPSFLTRKSTATTYR